MLSIFRRDIHKIAIEQKWWPQAETSLNRRSEIFRPMRLYIDGFLIPKAHVFGGEILTQTDKSESFFEKTP